MSKHRNWFIVIIAFALSLALTGCASQGKTIGRAPSGTPAATAVVDSGASPTDATRMCEVVFEGSVYQLQAGTTWTQPVDGGTLVISASDDCSKSTASLVSNILATPLPSLPTNVPTADPTPTPSATPAPTEMPTQAPTVVPPAQVPPTPIIVVVMATPTTPSLVLTPPSAPTGSGTCVNPLDLAVMVDAARRSTNLMPPYALIAMLDAHPAKQDHQVPGWINNGAAVVWTGSYVKDTSYGDQVVPVLVDGKTGSWLQKPETSVTWLTAGGSIAICENPGLLDLLKETFPDLFTTGATPASTPAPTTSTAVPATPEGPTCVQTENVVTAINTFKMDPDRVFVELDQIADAFPNARLRAGEAASYDVQNMMELFWVQTGQINGPTLVLHQNDSKSLYLATADGEVSLTYAHSGLRLCQDLNPVRDFPWWK